MRQTIERLHPQSLRTLNERLQGLVARQLWLQVLLGMTAGIGVGILLGPATGLVAPGVASSIGNWLALPGKIFLASIQMIVVPLVFASVIRGIAASENMEELRSTGLRAVVFFGGTTTLAIVLGIVLALIVQPGSYLDASLVQEALAQAPTVDNAGVPIQRSFPDAIVGLIPQNPLSSMVESEMLGVVFFAVVVGVALVSMPAPQAVPVLSLLGSLQQVAMTVVKWVMNLAPVAVFGLMAQLTTRLGLNALLGMAVYVLTVLGGLLLLLCFYVLLMAVFGRMGPLRFLRGVREVQLLAFSTSSSAAVMPLTIRTAEEALDVRPSVSQFVIPLGATINMNGTALYQGVATVFLAQVFGLELSAAQLGLIVVTAVGASIGSPATPGVGIVVLSMVLGAAGVPAVGLGLIIGVDRILDMARTSVNVTGDLVAARLLDLHAHTVSSAAEQRRAEEARSEARQATGEDVVLDA